MDKIKQKGKMQMYSMLLSIKSDDFIKIFQKFEQYFSQFSIFAEPFREFGWGVLKGMCKVLDWLYILSDKIFEFLNFMDSQQVNEFFETIKPFIYVILLLAIGYLAYCYIFAREKPKGILVNTMIFVGTMIMLPYLMGEFTNMVKQGRDLINADIKNENIYQLLSPYITDLVYLDSIDFDSDTIKEKGKRNTFKSKIIKYLDINEVVDPNGDIKLNNKKLFERMLTTEITDGNADLSIKEIPKNKLFLKDITPYYYRYHVDYFIAFLYLLALIIVLALSTFKTALLIYELISEKLMAPFIAAGDITNGQKIRKLLMGILNTYITIITITFLQKIYIMSCDYINATTFTDNATANGFIQVFLILVGAFFVIDGPNIFEQIFGVDAGLKNVGQAIQSAYYSSQMLSGFAKTAEGTAKAAGNLAKKSAANTSKLAGVFSGIKNTTQSHNEQVAENMSKQSQSDIGAEKMENSNTNDKVQESMQTPKSNTDEGNQNRPDFGFVNNRAGNNQGVEDSLKNSSNEHSQSILDGNHPNTRENNQNQNIEDLLRNNDHAQGRNRQPSGTGTLGENAQNISNQSNDILSGATHTDSINSNVNSNMGNSNANNNINNGIKNWAKENTTIGQKFTEGEKLGNAIGNSINHQKEKKEQRTGAGTESDKGNLRG